MAPSRNAAFGDSRARQRGSIVWLLVCVACAGCAPMPQAREKISLQPEGGDPAAPPSLAALPDMQEGITGNTVRTHQGLLLARQTLDTAFPLAPADRSYASLQRWIDTTVVAWVERRRAQTDATRDRFLLEGEPSEGELIVSHAVVGLIHEDTARSLAGIPAPSELDSEPEIAGMYRDIIRTQADSFVSSALLELRDCANGAYRGPKDMRAWAGFCHARFDRLQEQVAHRGQATGKLASKTQ